MNLFCKVASTDLGPQPELVGGKFSILVADGVEAFAPACEAHSGYDSIGVAPGKPCAPCIWRDYDKF